MRLSILHVLQCTMVTRFNPIWERHRYMKLGSNLSTRNPTTSQSQKGYNIVQDDIECAQRLLNLASHAVRMKQRSDIIFPTSRRSVRTYARIKSTVLNALFRCKTFFGKAGLLLKLTCQLPIVCMIQNKGRTKAEPTVIQ